MNRPILSWKDIPGVLEKGHFVFQKGEHSNIYFNKDRISAYPKILNQICQELAGRFPNMGIDVVVGPQGNGGTVATLVALNLVGVVPRKTALVGYADKTENGFVFRRGYDELIPGKRILVADDVSTTGDTLKKLVELCRSLGGTVVGAAILCNRGGVGLHDIGSVGQLHARISKDSVSGNLWSAEECARTGLCAQGVPINTDLGHGREFLEALERQRQNNGVTA